MPTTIFPAALIASRSLTDPSDAPEPTEAWSDPDETEAASVSSAEEEAPVVSPVAEDAAEEDSAEEDEADEEDEELPEEELSDELPPQAPRVRAVIAARTQAITRFFISDSPFYSMAFY
jgi:hypothetical protein